MKNCKAAKRRRAAVLRRARGGRRTLSHLTFHFVRAIVRVGSRKPGDKRMWNEGDGGQLGRNTVSAASEPQRVNDGLLVDFKYNKLSVRLPWRRESAKWMTGGVEQAPMSCATLEIGGDGGQ